MGGEGLQAGGSKVSEITFWDCAPTPPAQAQLMRGKAYGSHRSGIGNIRGPLPLHAVRSPSLWMRFPATPVPAFWPQEVWWAAQEPLGC